MNPLVFTLDLTLEEKLEIIMSQKAPQFPIVYVSFAACIGMETYLVVVPTPTGNYNLDEQSTHPSLN